MNGITYIIDPKNYNPDGSFVAHVLNVSGKEGLLGELSNRLNFPEYFGSNWDALLDMLCDFSWIEQRKVVLVHDELPGLAEADMQTYVEILFEAVKSWQGSAMEHHFEVVFPEKVKGLIQQYQS